MLEKLQVYKCDVWGNMVEVLSVGGGTLTCCGKPMRLLTENTVDAAVEKHIPFAEERRLFYVALTRTRNKVYLVAPMFRISKSEFVNEIEPNAIKK